MVTHSGLGARSVGAGRGVATMNVLGMAVLVLSVSTAGVLHGQDSASRCPHGPASQQTIEISATYGQHGSVLAAAVDSTLAELGYVIDTARSAPGRWVTVPRFAWPAGTEKERWHGAENPGVEVFVVLAPTGDSTTVHFSAHTICAVVSAAADDSTGGVGSAMKLIAAMQVAEKFNEKLTGKQ